MDGANCAAGVRQEAGGAGAPAAGRGLERALVLALVLVVSATVFAPPLFIVVSTGLCLAATLVAAARRLPWATHLGLLATVLEAALIAEPLRKAWPGPLLIALAALALAVRSSPSLRPTGAWFRRGRLGPAELLLILGVVAVSSCALVLWFLLLGPDLSNLRAMFPPVHPALLLLGAACFSMANAFGEELVWRGALFASLERVLGRGALALVLQALSFGCIHYPGVPRGWPGVGLAAVYGLMLGVLRRRSGGLLAVWLAHVFADLTIAAILWSQFSS